MPIHTLAEPAAGRLRALLTCLLLPALVLSQLLSAAPAAHAQATPPPCDGATQITRWTGSISFGYADAKRWRNTSSDGTEVWYRDAASSVAVNADLALAIEPLSGGYYWRYSGPSRGSGQGSQTFEVSRTVTIDGVTYVRPDPSDYAPYKLIGQGEITGESWLGYNLRDCTASFQVNFHIPATLEQYEQISPSSLQGSFVMRSIPLVRGADGFTFSGTVEAVELWLDGMPPGSVAEPIARVENLANSVGIYYKHFLGEYIVARVPVTYSFRAEGAPPPAAVTLDGIGLQRQDRDSGEWRDLPAAPSLPDGSPARLLARLHNPGAAEQSTAISFRNTTTGEVLPGCPTRVSVPPTGAGAPHTVACELDTAGMAWADNDPATPGTAHTLEVQLDTGAASPTARQARLTVRPRPIVFVPGIGGNYAAGDDEYWLLHRGVPPTMLEIDPLIRSYDGILKTLENTGYKRDRDLFIANYDWRVFPGPADGTYDGIVTGLTPAALSDSDYSYGVDYLGEVVRSADTQWRELYGVPLDEVDVIAHSTGGIVTRTYIQSTAYGGVYDQASGAELPTVRRFISVGVPHRGASKAWNPLHDNWSIDPSFQAVLSKIVKHSYLKLSDGRTIEGPDGALTPADLADPATGQIDQLRFIRRYAPTINALLATYPFLNRGSGDREVVGDGVFANRLLLDLNNGADLASGRDRNAFLERTSLTAIGGVSERTPLFVSQRLGPADDVVARFMDFTLSDAEAGAVYFVDEWAAAAGDGTVPTISSVGPFEGDQRARVLAYALGANTQAKVTHTDLLDNPQIQLAILRTLDAPALPANLVALGRMDYGNIVTVVFDPVQGYLVDPQGRRLGWSEATGPLTEIPNSFWRGKGDGFGLIFGPISDPLRLELRGLDGPYYAQVQRLAADGRLGGVTLSGPRLGRAEVVSGTAVLPGEFYLPMVRANGPYAAAEGASVPLSATGEAGLSYAWDLNGDGTFETAGRQASFSGVGVDGPATRTVTVRGTLPTGQSATSTATVTVTNVAPTATISAPATATVGQPFNLALTGAIDPGGDPLRFAFDCGQGYGPLGASSSVSCTPSASGTLTVRASVADDDGGVNTYTAAVTVAAATQPNRPQVPLCYASGAQTWQDFAQGRQKNGRLVPRNRSNPALALGMPQRNDAVNFVSLGFGGSLTIRFANPLVNDGTSAADLRIWETSFGDRNRPWSRYPEAARLEVSLDGQTWTEIGRTSDKDQAYDLALPRVQFVRVTDISDPGHFGPSDDGFDLDAIQILSGCVQP